MDLAQAHRARNGIKAKETNGIGIGLNSNTLLIIKLPDSRVLRIVSRSLFLAIILLTLPSIGSLTRSASDAVDEFDMDFDQASLKMVHVLFPDLADEGLLRRGQKGLVVGSGIGDKAKDLEFLKENDIDLVIETSLDDKGLIPNETFDFVFGLSFKSTNSLDRVLKTGGIVVTQLNNNEPIILLQKQPNYRIVYLRRFQNTMVAIRKVGLKDGSASPTKKSKPCGISQEARKVALKGLEDPLLEPPRRTLKSKNEPRKMRFLPDLLGDSLAAYPRRVFISDEKNGVHEWFYKNYPTKNQYFEMYNLEVKAYSPPKSSRGMVPPAIGIADWLRSKVKQDDFVVIKAEAQVVEEMMKEKTLCLIDELFLECKNQWQEHESKRAYWQCLALYGSLKDQGIAVHQWWS